MGASHRINARIDAALARRIDAAGRRTGKTVSEIVKTSLRNYCDSVLRETASPAEVLRDFVGCAAGPGDLSRTYKQHLRRTLERKL